VVGGATRVLSMALPQLMEQKNFLSIPFKEEKLDAFWSYLRGSEHKIFK
jgi:hypothetical protein